MSYVTVSSFSSPMQRLPNFFRYARQASANAGCASMPERNALSSDDSIFARSAASARTISASSARRRMGSAETMSPTPTSTSFCIEPAASTPHAESFFRRSP